jgi:hypothetical protein
VIFSGSPVSSTNETDRRDLNEILLKVALDTITITITMNKSCIQKVDVRYLTQERRQDAGYGVLIGNTPEATIVLTLSRLDILSDN